VPQDIHPARSTTIHVSATARPPGPDGPARAPRAGPSAGRGPLGTARTAGADDTQMRTAQ